MTQMTWLVVAAVLLDAASTIAGLARGAPEAGPVASRLLPLLGPAYWAVEAAVVHGLARILEERARLPRSLASALAVLGPWTAAWHNLALLIRGGG